MRKRRVKKPIRPALPAAELEAKLMNFLREHPSCASVSGISIVYIETQGAEPNWFAHPLPRQLSDAGMRQFVAALGQVRRAFNLLQGKPGRIDQGQNPRGPVSSKRLRITRASVYRAFRA
jgi:hypothetical protein